MMCLSASFLHTHTHTHTHTNIQTRTHARTHTRCSSNSVIVTLLLIRRTASTRAQFRGRSSTTNAHSETGQFVVCQNLTLGALRSPRALPVLVGARSHFEHGSYEQDALE
jgi:hypothetical protein